LYLSNLKLTNFRQFGDADQALSVTFQPGITALVGRNDSGKTAVIDAIRYALLTRDQQFFRVQPDDFHVSADGSHASSFSIVCQLSDLSLDERAAFAEHLSFEDGSACLFVCLHAHRKEGAQGSRRWVDVTVRSGSGGQGPALESSVRELLAAAYLRPLRDAERELSAGRSSRLSQILSNVHGIKAGEKFDASMPFSKIDEIDKLSLVGLSDFFAGLIRKHAGIEEAEKAINEDYLKHLLLNNERVTGQINLTEGGSEEARLKQILERLELAISAEAAGQVRGRFGLGTNNLLFMACELLLLGKEPEGLPLLLIEEPEAHIHPQRQLRLMEFIKDAARPSDQSRAVQVVLTTHSPNLASGLPVSNMILLEGRNAHALSPDKTGLSPSDYGFLVRFLDTTKANLFFAHGVIIVEGDGEALLLPAIARALKLDLASHGVSIVNVGHTGLRRFSRIFQRKNPSDPLIDIPVSCIADFDVMPDAAPIVLGLVVGDDDTAWKNPKRRWRVHSDFADGNGGAVEGLKAHREKLTQYDGQNVKTFVSDHWTLEFDLARCGLAELVHRAATLAKAHEKIQSDGNTEEEVRAAAKAAFGELVIFSSEDAETIAIAVYNLFKSGNASKAIAAQYLAYEIDEISNDETQSPQQIAKKLPKYLVEAICHACGADAGELLKTGSAANEPDPADS
jgi:putative ATP-dependent endonuclease of OLD family